jgi:hypothetical protein
LILLVLWWNLGFLTKGAEMTCVDLMFPYPRILRNNPFRLPDFNRLNIKKPSVRYDIKCVTPQFLSVLSWKVLIGKLIKVLHSCLIRKWIFFIEKTSTRSALFIEIGFKCQMAPAVSCVTGNSRNLYYLFISCWFFIPCTGITRMPWGHFISKTSAKGWISFLVNVCFF